MTIKDLFNQKIMYIDDDFVILDNENLRNTLYDNRHKISPELANYTDMEIARIRMDAQKGLVIQVKTNEST